MNECFIASTSVNPGLSTKHTSPPMNFEDVRKLTITALFSDDELFEQIVLKGGNAMSLVYQITSRASLDLDFSLEKDFEDLPETRRRMERALNSRFAPFGFVPFEVKLLPKPSKRDEIGIPWWGGYRLEFKLVEEERYNRLSSNLEQLRREALVVGPNQLRVFSADLSRWEYTEGKVPAELDAYTIYVYTPAMIALEKLRAIASKWKHMRRQAERSTRVREISMIFTPWSQGQGFDLALLRTWNWQN